MSITVEKLKRDFAKNRKKAAVLGALSVVMLFFIGKAALEMRPRSAAANPAAPAAPATPAAAISPEAASQTEERIRQSQHLWRVLREKRGIDVQVGFTFDNAFFTLDPSRRPAVAPDAEPLPVDLGQPIKTITSDELDRRARIAAIRDQAKSLVVKSTAVGGTRPIAVINEKILTLGDQVAGFEVTAIRAREVEFKKDGVTLAVKMADESRQP